MKKRKFKNDKYKNSRGGYSRLLEIFCSKCGEKILEYQKDGAGTLKRMYLDRIFYPDKLVGLEKNNLKEIEILKCPGCKRLIGYPYVYKKEKRKAFRVFQDSIKKKIKKL